MDQLSTSVKEKFSRINVEEELKLIQKNLVKDILIIEKNNRLLKKKKTEKTLDYPIRRFLNSNDATLNVKCVIKDLEMIWKNILKEDDPQNLFQEFKENKLDVLC